MADVGDSFIAGFAHSMLGDPFIHSHSLTHQPPLEPTPFLLPLTTSLLAHLSTHMPACLTCHRPLPLTHLLTQIAVGLPHSPMAGSDRP